MIKLRSIVPGWLVRGLTQSLFILEGTLDVNFENCDQVFWDVVKKVRDDMCVEALVTAEGIINEVQKLKSGSISLFRQERFKLDKRRFNVTSNPCNTTKLNFAKQ